MPGFTIAQITDCHLKADKQAEFYGCIPYQNLLRVLSDIAKQQNYIDAVIFTGDLVQEETWQSYQNILDAIEAFDWHIPFYVIPGNHDEPELFNRFEQKGAFNLNPVIHFASWAIILFNSYAADRKGAGLVSATQLANKLKQIPLSAEHYLVALHHHIQAFNSFIDKYDLQASEAFLNWLKNENKVSAIIHGHVHTERQGLFAGKAWYACPASSVQFGHGDAFEVTDTQASYQQIELSDNGKVNVRVCVLDENV